MFQGGLFLVGFVLSVLLATFALLAFLKERLGIRSFVFWMLLSLGLAVLSLFPGLVDSLARLFSVRARGLFVLTVGLLLAYVLIFTSYASQRSTEKTVQRLSQEVSLLRYRLEYGTGEEADADSGDDLGSE
jgi:hypothetical protein